MPFFATLMATWSCSIQTIVKLPTLVSSASLLTSKPWTNRFELLGHGLWLSRSYLFLLFWVSNSISLLLACSCIFVRVLYRLFDINSLISVLSIIRYIDIFTCSEDAYSGQTRISLWMFWCFFTVSVICLSDKNSWASHSLSTRGTYSSLNLLTNCSQVTASFYIWDPSYCSNWISNSIKL